MRKRAAKVAVKTELSEDVEGVSRYAKTSEWRSDVGASVTAPSKVTGQIAQQAGTEVEFEGGAFVAAAGQQA